MMILNSPNLSAKITILQLSSVSTISQALSNLDSGAVIFIDVDDTLITPLSHHAGFMIDALKKERALYSTFDDILSTWRLARKIKLVDDGWPSFIEQLKKKHSVFALTAMDTGKFGKIPCMETWRRDELAKNGLTFTKDVFVTLVWNDTSKSNPASFIEGIFITGSYKKSEVMAWALKNMPEKPQHIVFIDDRAEQIEDIKSFCQSQNYDATLIHFIGCQHKPFNQKVFDIQRDALLKNPPEWLEDNEALALLNEQ